MATGIKQKTVKIGEQRAPQVIRDNTTARRAWNAATIGEVTAEPGITAKVVGKGSYETVVVYRTTETEGRIQIRGTCQMCCRVQAVEGGLMVLHGYERPGWGYVKGSCPGTAEPPAELSLALATEIHTRKRAEESAKTARAARYEALRAGRVFDWATWDEERARRALCPQIEIPDWSPRTGETSRIAEGWTDLAGGWQQQQTDAETSAWHARCHAEALETHVLPRFGQPLYEVVKA